MLFLTILFILFNKIELKIWDWIYYYWRYWKSLILTKLVNDWFLRFEITLNCRAKIDLKIFLKPKNIKRYINGEIQIFDV